MKAREELEKKMNKEEQSHQQSASEWQTKLQDSDKQKEQVLVCLTNTL